MEKDNIGIPVLRGKNAISMLILIVIASILAISGVFIQNTKAQKEEISIPLYSEEIATIQGNSLLPVSDHYSPLKPVKKINMIITAYSSTPWETWGDPFITASGERVRDGIVANNLLPFGTKVRIPDVYGDKIFIVKDRMHQRKGWYHLDIWFPEHGLAKNFGAKLTYIEVLEN